MTYSCCQFLFNKLYLFNLIFYILQLFCRIFLFHLGSFYSGSFFYNFSKLFWIGTYYSFNSSLSNYGISLFSDTCIHKKITYILQSYPPVIYKIFVFSAFIYSSCYFYFRKIYVKILIFIFNNKTDFGHGTWLFIFST